MVDNELESGVADSLDVYLGQEGVAVVLNDALGGIEMADGVQSRAFEVLAEVVSFDFLELGRGHVQPGAVKNDDVTPGLIQEFVERKQKPQAPKFWTEGA